jgi:hypothetical protein
MCMNTFFVNIELTHTHVNHIYYKKNINLQWITFVVDCLENINGVIKLWHLFSFVIDVENSSHI